MNEVRITINDTTLNVPSNITIMEAAHMANIYIPRLCFLKDINETSTCRICVVEVEGVRSLQNSCTVKVRDKMVVKTNTKRIRNSIVNNLELLAANHHFECWRCNRERNCEFLDLLRRYHIYNEMGEDKTYKRKEQVLNVTDTIVINSFKCLNCGRCISACKAYSGLEILNYNNRGFNTYVGPASNHNMEDAGCIYCGKCIQACPAGALHERDDTDKVLDLLEDKEYYTIAQVAPAVRVALGEEFGFEIGTNVERKTYQALRMLGFDDITDTNFAADVTVLEEGTELIERLTKAENNEEVALPLFTSCSPGWIRYIETYYPEFIANLSSCKSPQQMQGALIKHYYSKKIGIDKNKIKVVSIMPCIAKKHEANLPHMEVDGLRDVDYVLTTRELARLIKRCNIDFRRLRDYFPNSALAEYTGAGAIFGATGGVMEAALRTVKEIVEQREGEVVELNELRSVDEGIKEATVKINDKEVIVAAVHGAIHFPKMLQKIKENPGKYLFVEFMACIGGCINGGGQPIVQAQIQDYVNVRQLRANALHKIDEFSEIRKSHKNPEVENLYAEFLKKPGSKIAHHLLHTKYDRINTYSE
ncbi:MAG: 4Fe-4S dicluster domain-containing protein [Acholeplasmataceae bacterium]|nr:4Fe-4S dicluster domain-containing protein [Acholeplasmataceae bacterium]